MSTIQSLKYKTTDGSKMEVTNCPTMLGVVMLFASLDYEARASVLKEIQESHQRLSEQTISI